MKTLPLEFIERMKSFPDLDFDAFISSYDGAPARSLRANRHKITPDALKRVFPLGDNVGFASDGFFFDFDGIGNHPLHHAGAFYVQEPSAMMPVSLLSDIRLPDSPRILDTCAAPGGKTSQLADLITGDGFILSNEVVPKRAKILASNIERLGIRNAVVSCLDTSTLAELFPGAFDVVLVDAPCSGEGMMRRDDVAVSEWSPENVTRCAERQKKILSDAVKTLAPGGYLIYSTCTFSMEENEDNLEWLLDNYPFLETLPPPEAVRRNTADGLKGFVHARRFYPHLSRGEGQFAVLLKNTLSGERNSFALFRGDRITGRTEGIVRDFLSGLLGEESSRLSLCASGDRIIILPCDLPLVPKSIMTGVELGTVEKGRLEPHHRFFSAYGAEMLNKHELTDPEAKAYIRGLTFECGDFGGFGAVLYRGCAVGGVKISGGIAKNHYPKGLRTMS